MKVEGQSNQVVYNEPLEVHNILDLDAIQPPENLVVSFEKGQEIPLAFRARGDFFNCDALDITVKVNQTVFVRLVGEDFYFSTDLARWSSFGEFFTGATHLSTAKVGEKNPINALIELYQRV